MYQVDLTRLAILRRKGHDEQDDLTAGSPGNQESLPEA
jgi:hypothetical protein